MKNVLLATDLEGTAANVAAFALAIADQFGARLTVYHAFGKPDLSQATRTEAEREEAVVDQMQALMAGLVSKSTADTVISYEAEVDYPGDGILAHVESGDYDLVVIGLREASDGGQQFSSLSYRIIREAECSVLAIPPQASFHGVQEIIFATDLDRADEAVLLELQAWRQNLTADLYVVHVYSDAADKERAQTVMKRWREQYAERPRMHFELMAGDFTGDIGHYVRQREGDMLVLQSHTRGVFGRVFKHSAAADVAQVIEVPLLVMRGEDV